MLAVRDKVLSFVYPDGSETENQRKLVESAVELTGQALRSYLPAGAGEIPEPLHWVWVEVAIKRYNRIGSEGMTSEAIEGHRVDFGSGDDFEAYRPYIDRYLDTLAEVGAIRRDKVRFL